MAYLWRYKKQEDSEKERVERAAERFRKQYPDAYSRADYALSHMAPGETSFRNPDGTMTSFHPARSNRSSFFPNVGGYAGTTGKSYMQPLGMNTGYNAPGMSEGQARMDQIASTGTYQSRKSNLVMYQNPQGGQIGAVPGSKSAETLLAKGYTPYVAPRTAAQQFDINQSYTQGYGAPSPTIQQGPGGPYRVAGGVAAPYSPPNAFQRFGSDVSTAARGIGYGLGAIGTFAANLFNRGGQQQQQPNPSVQSQNFYAYNPSPVPNQPRRYFDF